VVYLALLLLVLLLVVLQLLLLRVQLEEDSTLRLRLRMQLLKFRQRRGGLLVKKMLSCVSNRGLFNQDSTSSKST
jgi:hypothetical protein